MSTSHVGNGGPMGAMVEAGLRERKKAATRELIVGIADRLFLEIGFEMVSLEEVAAECGLSVRTVLRYFDTKEALALSHEYALLARFRSGLATRTGEVLGFWRSYTGTVAHAIATRPEWYRRRLEALRPLPLWLRMTGILREQQMLLAEALAEESADANPLRPHLLAAALVTANEAIVAEWLANGGGGFDADAMQGAIDYVTNLF